MFDVPHYYCLNLTIYKHCERQENEEHTLGRHLANFSKLRRHCILLQCWQLAYVWLSCSCLGIFSFC